MHTHDCPTESKKLKIIDCASKAASNAHGISIDARKINSAMPYYHCMGQCLRASTVMHGVKHIETASNAHSLSAAARKINSTMSYSHCMRTCIHASTMMPGANPCGFHVPAACLRCIIIADFLLRLPVCGAKSLLISCSDCLSVRSVPC